MKKFWLVLLTVLLIVSQVSPALAAQVYPDVKVGHWAEKDIAKMKAKGIVAGFTDGYHPTEAVTREQAIVMIIRTMGKAGEAYGKKLPANLKNPERVSSWAKESVALAAELGFLSQEDLSNFRPKDPTKRYEMAIFAAKALGYTNPSSNVNLGFADEKDIPANAKGFIAAAREAGVMKGLNDNTFRPNEPLNRAQMASILNILDQKLNKFSNKSIYGKVFSVSTADNSVLVEVGDGLIQTIPLAKDAFIYKGKSTTLSAITKGDNIEVITNDRGEALYIEQVTSIEVPTNVTVKGKITLISRTPSVSLRIVKDDGSSGNYTLADNATILVDGISAQASALTLGQRVVLTITGNQATKVEVITEEIEEEPTIIDEDEPEEDEEEVGLQSYFVGEITNLDSSNRTIRLKTVEKIPAYVILDFRTIIIKRDLPITFSELEPGDQIIVVGDYDGGDFIATSVIVLDETN